MLSREFVSEQKELSYSHLIKSVRLAVVTSERKVVNPPSAVRISTTSPSGGVMIPPRAWT